MNKKSFLPFFFTEPVYVVKKAVSPHIQQEKEDKPHEDAVQEKKTEQKPPVVIFLPGDISSKDKDFLSKVLKAVNLSLEEITIAQAGENIQGNKNILFGAEPGSCGLPHTEKYSASGNVIYADTLSEISEKVELKKKLWSVLQEFF